MEPGVFRVETDDHPDTGRERVERIKRVRVAIIRKTQVQALPNQIPSCRSSDGGAHIIGSPCSTGIGRSLLAVSAWRHGHANVQRLRRRTGITAGVGRHAECYHEPQIS